MTGTRDRMRERMAQANFDSNKHYHIALTWENCAPNLRAFYLQQTGEQLDVVVAELDRLGALCGKEIADQWR